MEHGLLVGGLLRCTLEELDNLRLRFADKLALELVGSGSEEQHTQGFSTVELEGGGTCQQCLACSGWPVEQHCSGLVGVQHRQKHRVHHPVLDGLLHLVVADDVLEVDRRFVLGQVDAGDGGTVGGCFLRSIG